MNGVDEYVLVIDPNDPPLRRGDEAILFGVTTVKRDTGLIQPSGLDGRMLRLPVTTRRLDATGRIDPDSRTWASEVVGLPADEVLQLLRDLTAGGP
jgi:hypothetical protein